ncbi:HRD1 [Hepatospora eriocheir]|uniref:HRD1 n=1 Tax=Hepatospora eriocheir TaxID=1081669 RepID=A0A1X0Q5Z2_9MICR|nr:HRD1 [Hepatospora eriocheir]
MLIYGFSLGILTILVAYYTTGKFDIMYFSFNGLVFFEYFLLFLFLIKTSLLITLDIYEVENPIGVFIVNACYYVFKMLVVGYYAKSLSKFKLPIAYIKQLAEDFLSLKNKIRSYNGYLKTTRLLESLPDVETNEMCSICTDECVIAKELKCAHKFHMNCLKLWAYRESICPVCRVKIE